MLQLFHRIRLVFAALLFLFTDTSRSGEAAAASAKAVDQQPVLQLQQQQMMMMARSAGAERTETSGVAAFVAAGSNQLQQHQKQPNFEPFLSGNAISNVTVQVGTNAYLPCKVKQLGNKSVSWVRVRDDHILSVDRTTFIADERFQALYKDLASEWMLQIKYVQARDAGIYECQVSTEPKVSAKVNLHVVVPKTELVGDADRYVKEGSLVILRCIVRGALEPPSYIIWYHGSQQLLPDNRRGFKMQMGRTMASAAAAAAAAAASAASEAASASAVATNMNAATGGSQAAAAAAAAGGGQSERNGGGRISSSSSSSSSNGIAGGDVDVVGTLMVEAAKKSDSGNYTCSPSNSPTSTVTLHVINGESSASAVTSSGCHSAVRTIYGNLFGLVSVLLAATVALAAARPPALCGAQPPHT